MPDEDKEAKFRREWYALGQGRPWPAPPAEGKLMCEEPDDDFDFELGSDE
jgi:hypothetical protein